MARFPSWVAAGALVALAALFPVCAQDRAPFQRRPDIHGDQIVFTSEGDLWLGSLTTGDARRITNHPGLESQARFSPDGRRIAFSAQYDGGLDVYVMALNGGSPKRLTWDPRGVRIVDWTPDSRAILFISRRSNPENQRRMWSVPAAGGVPILLPIPKADHAAMDADGRRVVYVPVSAEWQHWKRYQAGQADDLWLADVETKSFQRLTDHPGIDTTPVWADGAVYFVSERDGIANLYRLNPADKSVTPITRYADGEVRYPASDGRRLVFQHGHALGVYDPRDNAVREVSFRLNSDFIHARERRVPATAHLEWTSLGPTGKRVLAEARGQIASVPVDEGDARVLLATPGVRYRYPSWSRDGNQMAFISDQTGEEQVWVAPAARPARPRQLTRDHVGPLGMLKWSPDGKYILTSDREMRIYLIDVKTGAMTLVDQADRAGTYDATNYSYAFSPDGKWLAYNKTETNWNEAVYIYNIARKERTAITPPLINSYAPAWDPTGKYLFFIQDRQFDPMGTGATRFIGYDKTARVTLVTLAKATKSPFLLNSDEEGDVKKDEEKKPEPKKPEAKPGAEKTDTKLPNVKVDLDGIRDRMVDVPVPTDRYYRILALEDRLLLMAGNDPGAPGASLRAFNMKDTRRQVVTTVSGRVDDVELSADNKKLMVRVARQYRVVDASSATIGGDSGSRVDLDAVTLVVDPRTEWRQMFEEAWRIARDFFYDPGLHGVDWKSVKTLYAAELTFVNDRSELNDVLGDMIAELNVGHAYISGGDIPGGAPSIPMGYLGADLSPHASADAYRIDRILPGDAFDYGNRSPLLAPGVEVKEGDYILAVGGRPVRRDEDIQALMVGTSGRVLSITVNSKPDMKGAREVRVRPLGDENRLRYTDWVASRREYVRKNGGENFAYIHIPDMGDGGLQEFAKHYYPNLPKDGIIYDVRYNGGGWISSVLLLHASSKPFTYFKPRHGASWTRQNWAFPGYSVALCNENSFSNAEEFSDAFKRLNVGPLVGVPTGGGEVGSGGGYELVDGGRIYIPNYAAWTPEDGWIIEGRGVMPDIVVEQDPAAVIEGRDPQLDRAIAYLKEQVAKKPVPRPEPPAFPNKAWRTGMGQPAGAS